MDFEWDDRKNRANEKKQAYHEAVVEITTEWIKQWPDDESSWRMRFHSLSDLETLWCFSPGARLLASGNDDLLLWDAAGTWERWVEALGGRYVRPGQVVMG